MKRFLPMVIVVILIFVGWYWFSATGDSDDTKSQNTVSEQVTDKQIIKNQVVDGVYVFVPDESEIIWEGRKTLIEEYVDEGKITLASGGFNVKDSLLVDGQIVLDMASIVAQKTGKGDGQDGLSKHLKSGDFFNVSEFPEATFVLKQVLPDSTNSISLIAIGDMTIKGITKEISVPIELYDGQNGVMMNGVVVLDRTNWDIRYGSDKFFDNLANNVIADEFKLKFSLVAKKGEYKPAINFDSKTRAK